MPLPFDLRPLSVQLALMALSRTIHEIETGKLDVTHIEYDDVDRVALVLHCVLPDPEVAVQAAQVAKGATCAACGSSEVRDAGGLDRLCIRCNHCWSLEAPGAARHQE